MAGHIKGDVIHQFLGYVLWVGFMVYATFAAIITFTSFSDPDALVLITIVEILAIAAIAVPVTFVIPAVFNVRRQADDLEDTGQ